MSKRESGSVNKVGRFIKTKKCSNNSHSKSEILGKEDIMRKLLIAETK